MRARGYALIMVIMVLALIALGMSTVMFVIDAQLSETRRILGETRAFYGCDSAVRIASAAVEGVIVANPNATQAQLVTDANAAVCAAAGGCTGGLPLGLMPPGQQLDTFNIQVRGTSRFQNIQRGPLTSVMARLSALSVFLTGHDMGTGRTCKVRESFSVGTITPFQLMALSAGAGTAKWYARGNRAGVVPVYAIGDLCLGSYTPAALSITRASSATGRVDIPGGGDGLACVQPPSGSHGVTNIGSFAAGTMAAWGGGAHFLAEENADRLRLPVDTVPMMQGGNLSDGDSARWIVDPVFLGADNQAVQQLKLAEQADVRIVDGVWYVHQPGVPFPGVMVYSDHRGEKVRAGTNEEKIVGNIDVGLVEALANIPGSVATIPDLPPRRYSRYEGYPQNNIGGATERDLCNGGGINHGAPCFNAGDCTDPVTGVGGSCETVPGGVNEGALIKAAAAEGVISYGALVPFEDVSTLPPGTPTRWVPGSWSCDTTSPTPKLTPFQRCDTTLPSVGTPPDVDMLNAGVLDGTRSGFTDYLLATDGAANGKILPINFDVAEFEKAVKDTVPGELGSYFVGRVDSNGVPMPFNGLVYITATWTDLFCGLNTNPSTTACTLERFNQPGDQNQSLSNSLDGPANGIKPPLDPMNGVVDITSTWDGREALEQMAYPYPLCSGEQDSGSSALANGGAADLAPGFPMSGCSQAYETGPDTTWGNGGDTGARPNAVRVYNASDLRAFGNDHGTPITPNQPPDPPPGETLDGMGFSIATNLPLYVLGSFNVRRWSTTPTGASVFTRSMLAGDRVTVLSREWSDERARWGGDWWPVATDGTADNIQLDPSDNTQFPAMSKQTCVRANLMTGWAPDAIRATEDFEQLLRVVEVFPAMAYSASARCSSDTPYDMLPGGNPFRSLRFDGSIYAGFTAVLREDPQIISANLPVPASEWRYDVAMANPLFQPPGAPRYVTGVQDRWVDTR